MEQMGQRPRRRVSKRVVGTLTFVVFSALAGWLAGFLLYGTCPETPSGNFDCLEVRLGSFADLYVLGATTGSAALAASFAALWWRRRHLG
ncbi:MAG: hypothetical protein ABIO67_06245 [Mycobacteriales bacterium]